ncbi:hypothetical protein A6A04_11550 [Paramagnetospirillum marisnigri]|uniref:Integrase catalytic domain-containing protein n=1 Tax=Paramagnetospirillum marisnigri TaxID=1285242 RepID=A0A178MXL8_9PROT|nr:hypothetical protein A6A04_11550 [Paramagnetospirillum marisnigri]
MSGDLCPNKLPLTAVHLMNNDVLATFEEHDAVIETVLSDNGREFYGRPDQHPYELFLQFEGILPTKEVTRQETDDTMAA